jgi:hypothetical protein
MELINATLPCDKKLKTKKFYVLCTKIFNHHDYPMPPPPLFKFFVHSTLNLAASNFVFFLCRAKFYVLRTKNLGGGQGRGGHSKFGQSFRVQPVRAKLLKVRTLIW